MLPVYKLSRREARRQERAYRQMLQRLSYDRTAAPPRQPVAVFVGEVA